MKVIRRTIFDKIDEELSRGGEILRVELTNDEFKEAVSEAFNYGKWHGYTVKSEYSASIGDYSLEKVEGCFTKSQFHYKNHKVITS